MREFLILHSESKLNPIQLEIPMLFPTIHESTTNSSRIEEKTLFLVLLEIKLLCKCVSIALRVLFGRTLEFRINKRHQLNILHSLQLVSGVSESCKSCTPMILYTHFFPSSNSSKSLLTQMSCNIPTFYSSDNTMLQYW
jgi:hypothetical protein